MRITTAIASTLFVALLSAQVQIDRPLVFTAADSAMRQVEGLAAPTGGDALVTAGTSSSGQVQWAQVGGTANALVLTLSPAATHYRSGMRLRLMPTQANNGPVTVNVDGLGTRRLRRTDLLLAGTGELLPGAPVEIEYVDSIFILLARQERSCPPGYLQVNGNYCIMAGQVNNQNYFTAVQYCADRGARLCTWDEYYFACTQQQGQMSGLFDNWEWFDDTADHTHTAVQGGRWQCRSQRSVGAVNAEVHSTRCCYRLR